MTDVFVSYSSQDRETAAMLVEVLKAQGWSVWWDRDIPAGSSWDDSIARGMNDARCMIVLWSPHSVTSRMVKDEANHAANKDALVPAMIADCEIPYGYGMIQAANLTDWDGAVDHPGLVQLMTATRHQLGRKTVPLKAAPNIRRRRRWRVPLALLLPVLAAAAFGSMRPARFAVRVRVLASQVRFAAGSGAALPTAPIRLDAIGAARLTQALIPAPESTRTLRTDRLLLRARPAAMLALHAPTADLGATSQTAVGISLAPIPVPESTTIDLRSDGGRDYHLMLTHPSLKQAVVGIGGRFNIIAQGLLNDTIAVDPSQATLVNDGGRVDFDVTLHDTAATLAVALPIRGIDLERLDRIREAQGTADVAASTIINAAVTIESLHTSGPTLGQGEPLALLDANGTVRDLRLTPAGIAFAFEGTIHCLGAGGDAERCGYRPTWLGVARAQHASALVGMSVVYVSLAGLVLFGLGRKR